MLGLLTACAAGHASPTQPPAPATAASRPGPASAIAPDRSLTPEQYFALGMPAIQRTWLGDDLAKAQQVIAKLADEDPLALPRRSSAVSGEVFGRIASAENYAVGEDEGLPILVRLQIVVPELGALGQITKAYLRAMSGTGGFGPELVDLECAGLSTSRVVSVLATRVEPPPAGAPGRA